MSTIKKWYIGNVFEGDYQNVITFYSSVDECANTLQTIISDIYNMYNTIPLRRGLGISAKFDEACLRTTSKVKNADEDYISYLGCESVELPRNRRMICFDSNEFPDENTVNFVYWELINPEDPNSHIQVISSPLSIDVSDGE